MLKPALPVVVKAAVPADLIKVSGLGAEQHVESSAILVWSALPAGLKAALPACLKAALPAGLEAALPAGLEAALPV